MYLFDCEGGPPEIEEDPPKALEAPKPVQDFETGDSSELDFLNDVERRLPGEDRPAWKAELLRFEPEADPHIVQEALDQAPVELLEFMVTRRRPREVKVFQCLLRKGHVTKRDCSGFDIVVTRDLRKEGVPFRQSSGRHYLEWGEATIGSKYLTAIPDRTRKIVLERAGGRCEVCLHKTDRLFPDHCEPRELVGDIHVQDPDAMRAYCQVCNNRKMRACRECPNNPRNGGPGDPKTCHSCKWANPKSYSHEAMVPSDRLVLSAFGPEDVSKLDRVRAYAEDLGLSV